METRSFTDDELVDAIRDAEPDEPLDDGRDAVQYSDADGQRDDVLVDDPETSSVAYGPVPTSHDEVEYDPRSIDDGRDLLIVARRVLRLAGGTANVAQRLGFDAFAGSTEATAGPTVPSGVHLLYLRQAIARLLDAVADRFDGAWTLRWARYQLDAHVSRGEFVTSTREVTYQQIADGTKYSLATARRRIQAIESFVCSKLDEGALE